jgi:hypothetical protein
MAKKKSSKKKVQKKKSEKVCETFEVEKNGKETTIKSCSNMPIKSGETKKTISKENKQLIWIFVSIGIIVAVIALGFFLKENAAKYEYNGVEFKMVNFEKLYVYETKIPIIYQGRLTDYNFYIRNNPLKLKKDVPVKGNINIKSLVVLNMTENSFNCDGDGNLALANMAAVIKFRGGNIVKDSNASCDSQDRYTFINIKSGEKTEIVQIGDSCYNFFIKDCEILQVTERYLLEEFVNMQ